MPGKIEESLGFLGAWILQNGECFQSIQIIFWKCEMISGSFSVWNFFIFLLVDKSDLIKTIVPRMSQEIVLFKYV